MRGLVASPEIQVRGRGLSPLNRAPHTPALREIFR